MKDTEFKKQLLRRYVDNKATLKELEVLRDYIEKEEIDNELYEVMEESWDQSVLQQEYADKKLRKLKIVRWSWMSAAAVLLMIGAYFITPYLTVQHNILSSGELAQTAPVLPGKNTAVIKFSNGKAINLSTAKSGLIIGANALSYSDGTSLGAVEEPGQTATATITTPRGGTYQVILKDGSKIQLNAASSITFSADFDGLPERRVSLSGEAYFEVAKRKSQPFVVTTKNQTVSVLGTHFNISAYDDDRYTLTTLLEGSVKINDRILKPNEQAQQSEGNITIREVDAADAVDWKNGEFIARNESLENLMKKVSRWYDVDIAYENTKLKDKTFSGSLSRYSKAEDLLNALKFYGINSRLSNRKIYITN